MSTKQDGDEQRRLRPVPPLTLIAWGVIGLAVGWSVRPLSERWWGTAPLVTWTPALLLGFGAAVLAALARSTRRALRGERERPGPMHMVNRFVLGRACALVGAVVTGLYAGYALSWLGQGTEFGSDRVVRSAASALAAAAMTVAAVFLERACRVPSDDEES